MLTALEAQPANTAAVSPAARMHPPAIRPAGRPEPPCHWRVFRDAVNEILGEGSQE